jgi:hypothetical protein
VKIEPLVDAVSPSCKSWTPDMGRLRLRHIPDAHPVHLCLIIANLLTDDGAPSDRDGRSSSSTFTSTQSKPSPPPAARAFRPPLLWRRPSEAEYAFDAGATSSSGIASLGTRLARLPAGHPPLPPDLNISTRNGWTY